MNIAVVGSRRYPYSDVVREVVRSLPGQPTIVSGGATGVDTVAVEQAAASGYPVIVITPQWEKYGRSAGFLRNSLIVDHADMVLAFWDEKSRGTIDTINKALKAGKRVM